MAGPFLRGWGVGNRASPEAAWPTWNSGWSLRRQGAAQWALALSGAGRSVAAPRLEARFPTPHPRGCPAEEKVGVKCNVLEQPTNARRLKDAVGELIFDASAHVRRLPHGPSPPAPLPKLGEGRKTLLNKPVLPPLPALGEGVGGEGLLGCWKSIYEFANSITQVAGYHFANPPRWVLRDQARSLRQRQSVKARS